MRHGSDWYKREPQSYLGGVQGLTAKEHAVFSVVLDLIYLHGGSVNNDPRWIAGWITDMGAAAVRKAVASLEERGKIIIEGDQITQKRAKTEAKTKENLRETARKNGEKGGKKSAEKRAANNKNKDLDVPTAKTKTQADKIREDKNRDNNSEDKSSSLLSARARDDDDPPDQYQEFLKHHPRPRETSRGEEAWGDALASGQAPEDLIASARRYADASKSFDRDKVQFSDNWLSDRSWTKYPPIKMQSGLSQQERDEHRRDQQVKMIKGGNALMCSHISAFAAEELVAMKLVTEEQCRKVGVL